MNQWPLRLSDYPPRFERKFMRQHMMNTCGCDRCDNWWTQPKGFKLRARASASKDARQETITNPRREIAISWIGH